MKFLEVTQEIEQVLVHIFDKALKAEGMGLLAHVDKIRNAIVEKKSSNEEPPNASDVK